METALEDASMDFPFFLLEMDFDECEAYRLGMAFGVLEEEKESIEEVS